jgi:hypothetical protein
MRTQIGGWLAGNFFSLACMYQKRKEKQQQQQKPVVNI